MARPCPACGRPNADTAAKCLYCVAPLPAVEALPAPSVDAAKTHAGDRHLLILLPNDAQDAEAISAFSRIASISTYDARLALSTGRPRLFRRIDDDSEARRLSEALSSARVPHYVVSEASVTALPIARAAAMDFQDLQLEAALEGSRAVLHYSQLFLLVRGEITRERHDERKVGSAKAASRRLTPGLRLHLYPLDASPVIEVDPDVFDFGFLEEEKTASSLLNFEKLIARISERAPTVSVDRGFDHEPVVLSRSGGGGDVAEALSASEKGPSGVAYDDEAGFRFYSRWRYRAARYLHGRSSA